MYTVFRSVWLVQRAKLNSHVAGQGGPIQLLASHDSGGILKVAVASSQPQPQGLVAILPASKSRATEPVYQKGQMNHSLTARMDTSWPSLLTCGSLGCAGPGEAGLQPASELQGGHALHRHSAHRLLQDMELRVLPWRAYAAVATEPCHVSAWLSRAAPALGSWASTWGGDRPWPSPCWVEHWSWWWAWALWGTANAI